MSTPVTVRLEESAASELKRIAERERRSVSEVGARILIEGLRMLRFPHLEYRSFMGERHACVKGALQVWQVVMVARDYDMDVDKTAEHLVLTPDQLAAALAYYAAYPAEIDRALEENDMGYEGLKAYIPNIELVRLSCDSTAS